MRRLKHLFWLVLGLLLWPCVGMAQQVLGPQPGVAIAGSAVVGTLRTGSTIGGCSAAQGFPTGMQIWERYAVAPDSFVNMNGALRAYQPGCTPFTVSEGSGAATIAFGTPSVGITWGRALNVVQTTGQAVCPANQVISLIGGQHRVFTGSSGLDYPTTVYFVCRPVQVVAGDWFQLNLAAGGSIPVAGSTNDAATAAPLLPNVNACVESATRTCNGLNDTGGGELIDGFTGVGSLFPNARVSQRISFVNVAWPQAIGTSTNTATWRPTVAGVNFYPSSAVNNTARYQQAYESYTSAGTAYSGGVSPPAGANTFAYSNSGTCATAHALAVNEDYTCTNIITGRPDLQVAVIQPTTAWTSYGQYQNVTLTAKNFGPAPTSNTDNSTAVLTLPTGWDAGVLPANCAKAGSPVVVTCQVNPTPLAPSSAPGLTDGGQVDFVIPVTPLAGVAAGNYPVANGAKVCVQAATPGNTHVCTVPNDADPNNDDGINLNEAKAIVLAYVTPPALPPTITTSKVSIGATGGYAFTSSNNGGPQIIYTSGNGVAATAPPQSLTAINTSTFIQETATTDGTVLTGIACTGVPAAGTATVSLPLRRVTLNAAATGYGSNIACTFTNVRLALTVGAVSVGGTGTFAFTGSNGYVAETLGTATPGVPVSGALQSLTTVGGATTITEAAPPPGWRLSSVACTGLGTGGTATPSIPGTGTAGGSVTLNAAATAAGSNIACTFTNTRLPTLTVSKVSVGGIGSFAFTGTNGIAAHNVVTTVDGTAAAGATQTLTAESVATSVTEGVPPSGYALTGMACTGLAAGGTATPNLATRTVALNAAATAAGSDIACTFTNRAVPALKLVKTASAPSFVVGTPASYTLTLTNPGVFASTEVATLTDSVPATLALGAMPAGCTAIGQLVTCAVPAGLAAVTGTASFVIPVTPLATATPSVSNTALANGGGDPLCVGTGNCTSTVVVPVLAQPSITLRKTKTNIAGTHTFGFTLTGVTNPGDSIAVTTLNAPLASATAHVGSVGTPATLTESSVPAGWPAAPVSASCLDANAPGNGNVATNLATLTGNTATLDGSVMKAGALITCTFTNTAASSVALTKTAPATVAPGGALAYGLALANTGAVATGTTVVVREQLPPGVVATSVTPGTGVTAVACGTLPSAAGAALTCTMTIAAGIPALNGTRSFTLNATAPSTAALAATGTVLTNHAATNVAGSGTAAMAPGTGCASDAVVSCANASTTLVAGVGATALSGVRTVTDNQWADGAAQDVLEAMVRDIAGNPVGGAVVTFAATANVAFNGGTVGAAGTCTTDAAGRCQVSATSTLVGARSTAVSIAAGVMTGTFTSGGNAFHASPATYAFIAVPPAAATVTIRKVSLGGVGTFGFTGTNGLAAQSIVTASAGTPVAAGAQTLAAAGVVTTVTEDPLPANYALSAVACTGLGTGGSATPDLANRKVTLNAAATAAGANIVCTFTNRFGASVAGRVFNDNGTGGGTANDGVVNGGEAGLPGVGVRLTDCAGQVFAVATTDGNGAYALAVPTGTAAAAPLCVEETNPAVPSAWTSTGASVGTTAVPSGAATTVGGTAYTYTRAGTPDRIAFTWNGTGHTGLHFGDVAPNTLAADSAKNGLPGGTVSHAHTFTAQTGGSVSFAIPVSVDTPTLGGWSGKIFADTGCTGGIQAGAALLFPPAAPLTVVAGQALCIVMQAFIPANALNGNSNRSTVEASFTFTNAAPGLGASYTVHDITTASTTALDLKKEVRNLTQAGAFGINNQAKSGETLEYRIAYANNGATPITGLTVNDATPAYTTFAGAAAGTTPTTLAGCQKRTPANPLPAATVACATLQGAGGTGGLSWSFAGALDPGASGTVVFTVKVD